MHQFYTCFTTKTKLKSPLVVISLAFCCPTGHWHHINIAVVARRLPNQHILPLHLFSPFSLSSCMMASTIHQGICSEFTLVPLLLPLLWPPWTWMLSMALECTFLLWSAHSLELWHDNILKLQFAVSFRLCLLNELLALPMATCSPLAT